MVCGQVAYLSIWSIGLPFCQLAGSLVHHRPHFFLWLVVRNGETKIQECAKKNNTWNRKFNINTLILLWKSISFIELLPLQILHIFVSPLLAVGHITHPSIFVVGSLHHTSRSINFTSFTISNRLYWIGLLSSSLHLHLKYWFTILSTRWFVGSSPSSLLFVAGRQKWWNKNTRMCKEKQYMKQKIENKYLFFSWTYRVGFTELLPLQILHIFVSPLSAVGHITHPHIFVVGSLPHTSHSIHLTSFTISNCA